MGRTLCPCCGQSDQVRRSPEPLTHGDLIDTAVFGTVGYLWTLSHRSSVLRCDRCGCRFRCPTNILTASIAWLALVGVAGTAAYIGTSLATSPGDPAEARAAEWISVLTLRPAATIASAGVVMLICLLTVFSLSIRLRLCRRSLLAAKGRLRSPGVASTDPQTPTQPAAPPKAVALPSR